MFANPQQPDSDPPKQAQFLRLFLSSERELFRYVAAIVPNAADAEEIVQQAAVLLWEKFDQYDPQYPFTPWACRFALNVAKQWITRRQRWKTLLDGNLAEELLRRREEMLPLFDSRFQHLEQCVGKLPREQRTILDDYYFRHTSVESISTRLGRSIAAIYKDLQRIRRSLRKCIEHAAQLEADPG
jgi:RNA polymerase sigma-70 factor, ECF subfamily